MFSWWRWCHCGRSLQKRSKRSSLSFTLSLSLRDTLQSDKVKLLRKYRFFTETYENYKNCFGTSLNNFSWNSASLSFSVTVGVRSQIHDINIYTQHYLGNVYNAVDSVATLDLAQSFCKKPFWSTTAYKTLAVVERQCEKNTSVTNPLSKNLPSMAAPAYVFWMKCWYRGNKHSSRKFVEHKAVPIKNILLFK